MSLGIINIVLVLVIWQELRNSGKKKLHESESIRLSQEHSNIPLCAILPPDSKIPTGLKHFKPVFLTNDTLVKTESFESESDEKHTLQLKSGSILFKYEDDAANSSNNE